MMKTQLQASTFRLNTASLRHPSWQAPFYDSIRTQQQLGHMRQNWVSESSGFSANYDMAI